MTGTVLGKYEILDKLGEGGMGEVWRGRDRRLERLVAIKILPPEFARDPVRRARFEQEARALGALNHPNIVAIFDVGEDGGRSYIVSELVEGESLRTVLDRGALPVRRAIEIAGQIADGMAAAHTLGIIHRDLKPENIRLSRSGQAKLLDFGLAKQNAPVGGDSSATIAMSVSEPGMVMGTVGYMSPEQVRGEPADARSDIFSFGCVAYEMSTGKRAFLANTAVETMHAILHADPPEGESQMAPPALSAIIRRCLEKRPEHRFQSALDLAFALHSIAPSSTGAQPALRETAQHRPRRQWLWTVTAPIVAILLFALGYLVRSSRTPRTVPSFQRITFRKGFVSSARFMPHSHNIIYQASWEGGEPHTYLAVPGSPESRDLEMPSGGLTAVSAQEELALITAPFGERSSGRLIRVSISGGQTRPLLDGVIAADWAPDGSSMAVLRWLRGAVRLEYPVGTVLSDRIGFPLGMVRVSPNGERVAYASITDGTAVGITVVDRSGKKNYLGRVSGQNITGESSALTWSSNGYEIWFRSFDPSEPGIIYAVDLHGKRRVVLRLPSQIKLWDINRTGDLLFSSGSLQAGIMGKGPEGTAERDLSCLDSSKLVGISDDGRMIAANVSGEAGGTKGDVYLRKTDGSPPIRAYAGRAYRISPDGNWIGGYTLNADGSRRFIVSPTGPGEETVIESRKGDFAVVYGWLDGDERYLVGAGLPGKKWQCFIWDASSRTLQPLCAEGSPDSLDYFVSPDRKQVLALGPQRDWRIYSVNGGSVCEVQGIAPGEAVIGWRADGRSVYVRPGGENRDSIPVSIVDVTTGKRSPWKTIHPSEPVLEILNLYVTPDGRAYAYNYVTAQSDLYVAHGLN